MTATKNPRPPRPSFVRCWVLRTLDVAGWYWEGTFDRRGRPRPVRTLARVKTAGRRPTLEEIVALRATHGDALLAYAPEAACFESFIDHHQPSQPGRGGRDR